MFQVRIHGRGGQGAVTAAELLSIAAFAEGKHAQAFPSFGSERMGAPVVAFCRIDDAPIRLREPVVEADAIIVQDPTLLHAVDVFQGLRPAGYVLLNTTKTLDALGLADLVARLPAGHARCVAGTDLARRHVGKPVPNAALLGGFASLTRVVSLDAIRTAIGSRFHGGVRDGNAAAATEAFRAIEEIVRC